MAVNRHIETSDIKAKGTSVQTDSDLLSIPKNENS
jgi:hypothetical protein